jgi:hypothetical protein
LGREHPKQRYQADAQRRGLSHGKPCWKAAGFQNQGQPGSNHHRRASAHDRGNCETCGARVDHAHSGGPPDHGTRRASNGADSKMTLCRHCHTRFKPVPPSVRYCSDDCRRLTKIELTKAWQAANPEKHRANQERLKARRKRQRLMKRKPKPIAKPKAPKPKMEKIAKPKPIKHCSECTTALPSGCDSKRVTCGAECARRRQIRITRERAGPKTRVCVECGTPFALDHARKVCSIECKRSRASKRLKDWKESHPDYTAYASDEMSPRRLKVFEAFCKFDPLWPDKPKLRDPNLNPHAMERVAKEGRMIRNTDAAPSAALFYEPRRVA